MVSKEILIEIVKTRIKIVFVFLICALFEVLKKSAILILYLQVIDSCWTHLSTAKPLWIQEVK